MGLGGKSSSNKNKCMFQLKSCRRTTEARILRDKLFRLTVKMETKNRKAAVDQHEKEVVCGLIMIVSLRIFNKHNLQIIL